MIQDYRDEYEQFHTEKKTKGENGISYTGDFVILGGKLSWNTLQKIISAHFDYVKKRFTMAPWDKRRMSHDNCNGAFVLCNESQNEIPELPKIAKYSLHPRDLCFYLNLRSKLARPLLWISSLCFIESCLPGWKVRPGPIDRFKIKRSKVLDHIHEYFLKCDYEFLPKDEPNNGSIKNYDNEPGWEKGDPKRLIIRKWAYFDKADVDKKDPIYITKSWVADGKRLNFQRFYLLNMPITAWICDFISRKLYGDNYGASIYHIIYKDIEHQVLKMAMKNSPNYKSINKSKGAA